TFCKTFWIPFLRGAGLQPGDKSAELPTWIRAITWLPLRWLPLALLVLVPFAVSPTMRASALNMMKSRPALESSLLPPKPAPAGDLLAKPTPAGDPSLRATPAGDLLAKPTPAGDPSLRATPAGDPPLRATPAGDPPLRATLAGDPLRVLDGFWVSVTPP